MKESAATAPDAAYREEWRPFEADPGPLVFLVGCQRSGTTWLHLQLARTGAFRFLSAYDVYAWDTLVHNRRQGVSEAARQAFEAGLASSSIDRGIDTIPAGPDTPEEYGLVISYAPDGVGAPALRYDQPDTTEATLPRLLELCAKKALIEGRDRPLLLKSPPDYPGGMARLAAMWPQARFVAIQRHPLRTLESQVRAWRQLVDSRNPYLTAIDHGYRALFADAGRRMWLGMFLRSQSGIDWLADCILRAHLGFLALRDSWAGANLLTIRYEDLCADQSSSFAQLSAFLRIDLPKPALPPEPREASVPAGIRDAFAARRDAFAPYLERFNYSAELA